MKNEPEHAWVQVSKTSSMAYFFVSSLESYKDNDNSWKPQTFNGTKELPYVILGIDTKGIEGEIVCDKNCEKIH